MFIICIILAILEGVLGLFFIIAGLKIKDLFSILLGTFVAICGFLNSCAAAEIYKQIDNDTKPQAIDVYRGKTTLQITYQDSIPVDSIVVFKN